MQIQCQREIQVCSREGEIARKFWLEHVCLLSDVLMKMLDVNALLQIAEDLCRMAKTADQASADASLKDELLQEYNASVVTKILNEIITLCQALGFTGPLQYAERSKKTVDSGCCTWAELATVSTELHSRIIDEFAGLVFMWIDEPEFYYPLDKSKSHDLFGEKVGSQFKRASIDIDEAGACYATGRYTACVFHLMRVAEAGLNAIAKRVRYDDPRPVWEGVLNYIDKQLRTNYDEMNALFKGDVEFLSGIASHMHDVNLAWRRRVAHVERSYTKEEAKRIFEATKGLMQHVAEKLSELDGS